MLNRFSVSVLLKSVIAVMGAAIIIMLALSARESWMQLRTANRISDVANISAYMFTAMNSLRVDRASTVRELMGDKQVMSALLKDARDKEMPALNALLPVLAATDFADRDQAIADLGGKIKRLAELQQQTEAALTQPKSARPAELG